MPARSSKLGVRTVTLVVDLLFKQGVKEAKSFSSMQTAHGGPVCFRSIAVTSDSLAATAPLLDSADRSTSREESFVDPFVDPATQ
jgi:hypothetical protein